MTVKQNLSAQKRVMRPLKEFKFPIIGEKVRGLLINVDRDLERLSGSLTQVDLLGNHAHLLNEFVRFAANSYESALYLAGDTPEDPRRKENYVISIPPINRQLLDLLFTLIYLLDDFKPRVREYMRSGWREIYEERHNIATTFSGDPQYRQHVKNLGVLLSDLANGLRLTAEEKKHPRSFEYWPHPDRIQDLPSKSRPFLRHLNKWFYHDTSAQSHLTFGGLLKVSMFLLADRLEEGQRFIIQNRFLQQFRGQQLARTLMFTLAIATEADAYCKLKNQDTIKYVWPILSDTFVEAGELWDLRYRELASSY
jgi:hypothetical protein